MAIMINCAQDWSFDMALADAKKATALPLVRGVHRHFESLGVALFSHLKTSARAFEQEFRARNNGHLYSNFEGYCGDAWLASGALECVSDWYKDAYNQRPHFDKRVFAMLCGLPTGIDTIVAWGQHDGLEGYLNSLAHTAKYIREEMTRRAWA